MYIKLMEAMRMSAKKENAENYELVGVEVTENGGYRVTIKNLMELLW